MKVGRLILTTVTITLFALLWNGLVHMVILREANLALDGIARPASERSLPLSILLTAGIAFLFVTAYASFGQKGGLRSAIGFGVFFAVLAGLLVDLDQFVIYPIPGSLVVAWFLFGFVEFCIYGVLAAWLYPIDGRRSSGRVAAEAKPITARDL
jgi:hypothetical protein